MQAKLTSFERSVLEVFLFLVVIWGAVELCAAPLPTISEINRGRGCREDMRACTRPGPLVVIPVVNNFKRSISFILAPESSMKTQGR
jgi:hypothetical protein